MKHGGDSLFEDCRKVGIDVSPKTLKSLNGMQEEQFTTALSLSYVKMCMNMVTFLQV